MIIGEHSRPNDLAVNPLNAKQLTNIRAAGKDDNVLLSPPLRLTLEQALAYIGEDELVEVTPRSIRLRKRQLDANERRKAAKRAAVAQALSATPDSVRASASALLTFHMFRETRPFLERPLRHHCIGRRPEHQFS
jgi:hypothetical protein